MSRWSMVLLVALRMAIGWHFLYEGLFKIDSDKGTVQYVAARSPLQAATGRLRDYFERAAPGELRLDEAAARVDAWNDEIVRVFKARRQLDETQKARLADLADKVKLAAAQTVRGEISNAEVVSFDWVYVHEEILKIAAEQQGERFTSLPYLQSSAGPLRPLFRGLARDMDGLERLTTASAQARIDQRCRETLSHFAAAGMPFTMEQQRRLAAVRDAQKAAIAATLNGPAFRARLEDYKRMRERVAADPGHLTAPFTRERLEADRKQLDVIAGELLGLVDEPLSELAVETQAIASVKQFSAGPLPERKSPAAWIDALMPWGLAATGLCLLLGLFTPLAAVAATAQLAMFYFASPPWPGLPATAVAGHYLYVDRNLIEAVAAMLIAATGAGRWASLDRCLHAFVPVKFRRPETAPVESLATAAAAGGR